jgi:hypothetical protein
VKIRTHLNVPTLNEPALPIGALSVQGRVPPPDGGAQLSAFFESLEMSSSVDRWRGVCAMPAARAVHDEAAGEGPPY